MRRSFVLVLILGASSWLAAACGSSVEVPDGGSGGAGGAGGSGGAGGGCAGFGPTCAWGCGSDAASQADCIGGAWKCPPGTVDMDTCPPGTCWGPPFTCEVCDNGWKCAPDQGCIGSCESFVCATCDGAPEGHAYIGACDCSCNNGSEYGCTLVPGCCNQDIDCGDKTWFPCVEHVCKQPVPGQCWVDAECGPGMKCQGASVCPCNFDCNGPDSPGTCVPG